MSGNETEVVESELSVDERLRAAEKKIEALKTDFSQCVWALLGPVVLATILAILIAAFGGTSEPTPSNRDASLEDLLSTGLHCYDSAEERAAVRQRALAAIDRIQWEQGHPRASESEYPLGSPGPPPVAVPFIRDSPAQGESWDSARCFQVEYLP